MGSRLVVENQKKKKRILFLAHRVPYPPDKGDKIRSYHILKYLSQKYDVYLACLCDNQKDWDRLHELQLIVKNIICERIRLPVQKIKMARAFLSDFPLTVEYFYHKAFQHKLNTWLKQIPFDAIYVYSSNMAEYVRKVTGPVKIIDFCDLDSAKFLQFHKENSFPQSMVYLFEANRLAKYEKQIAHDFDYILFINEREKRLFDHKNLATKLVVMPNGAELEINTGNGRYHPEQFWQTSSDKYLVFVGAMDYLPNARAVVWFVENVFYRLKALVPDIEFFAIGKNPPRSIRALHNPKAGIYITGYLEDIETLIAKAIAFVAPIHIARGMQTKLLEAMRLGVPVITSREAAEGIGARHEKEVLIANSPADYVQNIIKLSLSSSLRQTLINGALRFLKTNFRWNENLKVLEVLLKGTNKIRKPDLVSLD